MRIKATGVGSAALRGKSPLPRCARFAQPHGAHRRRLLLASAFLFAATQVLAQSRKLYRIGQLTARQQNPYAQAFEDGLRDHGYVVGKNVEIVHRWADATGSFVEAAKDLARANVDV